MVGRAMVWVIGLYRRYVSPLLPPSCRFTPSCSVYTMEAIRKHGPVKGSVLGAWRILRCNPFCKGGHDPVP
ncbi:TIGR00278: putative membrane protein insertion efficiency factor [Rubrobacter radiotolerans]|uniref:Putative membrane protein insertion efficiency factor n=2 Tax=Rubrobacter radiotolerans TaxID=42256 RepID=A0A023X2J0_RUBRA|nr:membrane protein insertion efficiency factor YidD [Rubrobacter radiotolerans]AHY46426.1 TIGR00278: putative membrane protein insertion efficiency factor [Rubrobacter radiotolerans]MDX5893833.1 membrane protein insertion efficiency factor YidD [Rubrobacter radiotolerans]